MHILFQNSEGMTAAAPFETATLEGGFNREFSICAGKQGWRTETGHGIVARGLRADNDISTINTAQGQAIFVALPVNAVFAQVAAAQKAGALFVDLRAVSGPEAFTAEVNKFYDHEPKITAAKF